MEYFLIGCLLLVGGFGIALLISTICIGTTHLLTLQVIMGSLRYSKEIDDKLDLELGKVDAGMYHVVVGECTMSLYSKDKYPDFEDTSRYSCKPEVEIWIANKFYSYGNLYRLSGGESPISIQRKRPSIRIIKQIYQLEKSKGLSTTKIKKDKSKAKTVVLG